MRFLAASATGRPELQTGGAGLRRRRPRRATGIVPALLAFVIVVGACSGGDTDTVTVRETVTATTATTTGTTAGEAPAALPVYYLQDGKVAPVRSAVVSGPAVARGVLDALLDGGVEEGFETAIPADTELGGVSVSNGVADVELSRTLPPAGQAQVVYTLTQFPTVSRVRFLVEGLPQAPPAGRAAYERFTPAILVESPLRGDTVEPGFEASGTANTFEATFSYELRDERGAVLTDDFVTATSGSGTRGTFEFTVPYEVEEPQEGTLVVFEISAANGSRTNEISIPLRLE